MATRIEVTAEDIKRGQRRTCSACPIALAAQRALQCSVLVGCTSIWQPGRTNWWKLPAQAQAWRERFDNHERVEPFTFEV